MADAAEEVDERPDTPREAFLEGIFDLERTFGLPLTNNEPRMQGGRWLHDVGDFAGAVEELANDTLLLPTTQALDALTDTVTKVQALADSHRSDAPLDPSDALIGYVAVSDLDALLGLDAHTRPPFDSVAASRS